VSGVSVVIPMFNTARYVREAIDSVLAQTVAPAEVIVVDDGSSDEGPALVMAYGGIVRCDRQVNRGIGAARNRGVDLAQGPLLAFLDADDTWSADKIERQLAVLTGQPDVDIVFGHVRQFRSPELPQAPIPLEVSNAPHAGTMLIRRDTFLRVGTFPTDALTAEFIAWYGRAVDLGLRMVTVPEVLMHRRLHETNTGVRRSEANSGYAKTLKQLLDRRRAQAVEP